MSKQSTVSMAAVVGLGLPGLIGLGCVFERASPDSSSEGATSVTHGSSEVWAEAEAVSGQVGGRSLSLVQDSAARANRNGRSASFRLTSVAATGSSPTFGDPAAASVPVNIRVGVCPLSRLTSGSDPSRYEYLLLHVCSTEGECYTGRPGDIWLEVEQLDGRSHRVTVEYEWPDGSWLAVTFRYGERSS